MILDFSNKKDISTLKTYPKSEGILLAKKYLPELDSFEKIYMVDSVSDWKQIEHQFTKGYLTLTTDTKNRTQTSKFPTRSCSITEVYNYIEQARTKVEGAKILCQEMKDGSNERINTKGAFGVLCWNNEVLKIDYVGPGFDGREISRGKAAHEIWSIPFEEVPFMKDNAVHKYKVSEISQEGYVETAKERIKYLLGQYPERKEEILNNIPKKYTSLNLSVFRKLREEIIFPLWLRKSELAKDGCRTFFVKCTLTQDNRLVPFEICTENRLLLKDKEKESGER